MTSTFCGRVAVITGAASGLGLAFAEALANEGASVVIGDVDQAGGEAAARKISAAGREAVFCKTDVSKRPEARALIDAALTKFGRLDILINNAGVQHISPIHEFDEDRWDTLIGVMLTGTFLTTRYAMPQMMSQKRGRVINISSIHGLVASEFKSAYCAAKHGIIGFTRVLALEGAPYNITTVAVCPSYVLTPLVKKQIAVLAERHGMPPSEVTTRIMLAPAALKQLIDPSEVAALIVYLCSDAAQVITGAAIPIDCGWTAR